MIHIMLAGASGRLGQEICAAARGRACTIHPLLRTDFDKTAAILDRVASAEQGKLVLIDVTLPEGTELIAQNLLNSDLNKSLVGMVIGSTGHSASQLANIEKLSAKVPVVLSSNFSRGIYLFEEILRATTASGMSVAELARQLGFDLSIWESHHTLKKDAPSGTAKTLAKAASVEAERIASTRVGAVVGEHTLFLSQDSEELRITHTAHARRLFADGALDLCDRISRNGLQNKLYTTAEAFKELLGRGS